MSQVNILFMMLDIFASRLAQDFSFLNKFYKYYIPSQYPTANKKKILSDFLDILFDKSVNFQMSSQTKVNASKYLICPMLIKSFKNGQVFLFLAKI